MADRDDIPTLIAIGADVAIAASLAHEALGHGLGCLADGGTISLLTFLVFRCDGAGALADGSGPVGAFLVAGLCLIALRVFRPNPSALSIFVYALGVQAMLWVCAQAIRDSIDDSDDWGHVARDLGWPGAWHLAVTITAAFGYVLTVRIAAVLGRRLADGRPARLLVPYAATCATAVILGALWHGDRAGSAIDGLLSFGAASLGYLFAVRNIAEAAPPSDAGAVARSTPWVVGSIVVCCAFAEVIARGIGRLA